MRQHALGGGKAVKVHIRTYGCSASQAESEMMAGVLKEAGFTLAKSHSSADIIIVNTCLVKTPTEQKIIRWISDALKENPEMKLIIAGCMPSVLSKKLSRLFPAAGLVSTKNAGRIAQAAQMMLSGERPVFIAQEEGAKGKSLLPRERINGLIGIIPISEGCEGSCTYCAVRLARGALTCYPPEEIAESARRAVASGCMELWITSQDNASYCHGNVRLPDIIRMVCAMDGDFMIRVGMMNPDKAKDIMDGLCRAYNDPKVYRFAHVPLQSGSARILKLMGRKYSPAGFESVVGRLRNGVPGITILTDVIVGFPGETDEEFRKTLRMMQRLKPDATNVSKFTARPGTAAAGMQQLNARVIKSRSATASILARKIEREKNSSWIGWEGTVLFTERGKKAGQYAGRNPSYKLAVARSRKSLLGKQKRILVTGASVTHVSGETKKS